MARYAIIIEPGEHNYSAYVPDVPGVIATGDTIEEVTQQMQEALAFHLEGLQLYSEPLPAPESIAATVDVELPDTSGTPDTSKGA